MLRSWKVATGLFFAGYATATTLGFGLYVLSPMSMWISMFTAMLIMFGWLAFRYFTFVGTVTGPAEVTVLTIYWIALSFVLDATLYVVALPLSVGAAANWTFFIDQSPWIWVAYGSFALIIVSAYYRRNQYRAQIRPMS